MKHPKRTPKEEALFEKLAVLCGLRPDKIGKRARRGYRVLPGKPK